MCVCHRPRLEWAITVPLQCEVFHAFKLPGKHCHSLPVSKGKTRSFSPRQERLVLQLSQNSSFMLMHSPYSALEIFFSVSREVTGDAEGRDY